MKNVQKTFEIHARKALGFPKNSKIDLSDKDKVMLIKMLGKEGRKKGKDMENRFLQAWEARHEYGSVSVRRATLEEDLRQKTDAIIEIQNMGTFKIQIKSHRTSSTMFEKFFKHGVVLISVLPEERLEQIRKNTLASLHKYMHFTKKNKKK